MQSRLRRPRNKAIRIFAGTLLFVLAAPAGAAGDIPVPQARPQHTAAPQAPAAKASGSKAKPAEKAAPAEPPAKPAVPEQKSADTPDDLSGAIPFRDISKLPTPQEQSEKLHEKIRRQMPAVTAARQNSEALSQETADLKKKLVVTAREIEHLEDTELSLAGNIARLSAENAILSRDFHKNSGTVIRQLATLERLTHTVPPAMVLKSGDVLSAARASMLMGATLPKIYQRTADLARKLERLRAVRDNLTEQQNAARTNAIRLRDNRKKLSALLKVRQTQSAAADSQYESLRTEYIAVAERSASLDALLQRIAALKKKPATRGWVSVSAKSSGFPQMIRPVAGRSRKGGMDGVGGDSAPGQTYSSVSGAQVVAPADGRIRYAGPYQKSGLVLILEMANGYDAVLAGLGQVSVHTGDRVLAGEPVGRLPDGSQAGAKLYFELRHDGQGLNPARFIDAG